MPKTILTTYLVVILPHSQTCHAFSNHFVASKKRKKNLAFLLSISLKKGEKLRDFIHCYNMERLEVNTCSDDVAIIAFTKGLKDPDWVKPLYLDPPKGFNEIMN